MSQADAAGASGDSGATGDSMGQAGAAGSGADAQGGAASAGNGGMAAVSGSAGAGAGGAGAGGTSGGSGTGAAGAGGTAAGAGGTGTSGTNGGSAGSGGSGLCDLGVLGPLGALTTSTQPSGNIGCALTLPGKVDKLIYEPVHQLAYLLDSTNRKISSLDLQTGAITARSVTQAPSAACVSLSRSRLFVADWGSSYISEYNLSDLALLRNIPWPAPSYGSSDGEHFHVYCGADRLYVVDANWAPGLWTIDNLDGCAVAVDHSAQVSAVGDLVLSADESELYYWYQFGWSAGSVATSVTRVRISDWSTADQTTLAYPADFYRDPLDAPVLWDPGRNLIFSKNRVFEADNLAHVVFTFADPNDSIFSGAVQNSYALDTVHGRFATRRNVYAEDTLNEVAANAQSTANQYFFDSAGSLRALVTATNRLECQTLP
jgi:hypothetical protein